MSVTVRVGFVPSFRFAWTPWEQKMLDDSLAAFAKIPGLEIVAPKVAPDKKTVDAQQGYTPYGMVNTLDEAEAIADYFASQKVDGLIICPLDFGDERSAVKVAEKLKVPVLLYATKEPAAVDDEGMGRVSDSYCGNLGVSSALFRRKIAFRFAGVFLPDEPGFLAEVDAFARAVAVIKGLKGARIGQVGVRPGPFETVVYDEAAMILKFGQNVITAEVSDLVGVASSLADDDPAVRKIIGDQKERVARLTVSDEYLLKAAKFEVALTMFAEKNKLSAMAVQCWASIQMQMGISTCAIFGRMTEKGIPTSCETDVLGTLAMITSRQVAMGTTKPHFIDWTIQHRENPNWLMAWHCGNAPMCLAKDPSKIGLRSRRDMKGELACDPNDAQQGLYQFQIKPGVVTFCRLQEYDNEWRMLIAKGEVVDSDEELAGTWSWVEVKDHAKLYRTLVEEGFIHHSSMVHGDYTQALLEVCMFMGIKPILVS